MSGGGIDIVVALSDGVLARLDVAGNGAPLFLPAPAAENGGQAAAPAAAAAVAVALRAAPVPRRARVLVISTEFFSQVVRLPRGQVAGLAPAELSAALYYEIEPFTNLPREQGADAFAEAPDEAAAGQRAWRAVQVSRAEVEAIAAAVRGAKALLAGCAPCVAAPTSAPPDAAAWEAAMRRAAGEASATPPRLPVALPAENPGEKTRRAVFLSALLFATAAAGCLAHGLAVSRDLSRLRREVAERETLASEQARAASALRDVQGRIAAIEQARASREAAAARLRSARTAWRDLLDGLPRACGEDVMLRSLDGSLDAGVRAEAIAADADAAADCMARLADEAARRGWRLLPLETVLRDDACRFRFLLGFDGPEPGGAR